MATLRQKKAIDKIAENGGNISKAMRESGYSKISSKTPKKLTDSKAWKEYMEKEFPDSLLAEKHRALLTKKEVVVKVNMFSGETEIIPTGEIDVPAVGKGLDMAYKLKGHYSPEKIKNINPPVIEIIRYSDKDESPKKV